MSSMSKRIFPPERFTEELDWVQGLAHNAFALLTAGFPLRIVLFHLFSSQIAQPEIALLFLGVMREAMMPRLGTEASTIFADREEWRRRIEPVSVALANAFEDVDADLAQSLLNRLDALNDVSVRKRRTALWRSVSIEVTADERKILEHRDRVSHHGYILDTSYDEQLAIEAGGQALAPYEKRLLSLDRESMIYRNLMIRTLLRIWGVLGKIIDATDSSKLIDI